MKKSTIAAILLSLFLVGSGQAKLIGDFNNDGEISLPDVIAFIMHIMDKETVPEIGIEMGVEREVFPQPTMGLDGPNKFVDNGNIGQLQPIALKMVHKVWAKASTVLYEKDSGRIPGDFHGYAEVFVTYPVTYPDLYGDEPYSVMPKAMFTAVFYDYSDNGELFLGGRLKYHGVGYFVENEDDARYLMYNTMGTLYLVGNYHALLNYALNIALFPGGKLSVRGRYGVLSWKNEHEASSSGGWLPEEKEVNGERVQGRVEIEIGE